MAKSPLSAAYYGYSHQDVVTAYAMASLLLPRPEATVVSVERKVAPRDRFDDLELSGAAKTRAQIKAHQGAARSLELTDFTTTAISFRIDDVVCAFEGRDNPDDRLRLFTTYGPPEDALLPFLSEDSSTPPLLPGLRTRRFRLDVSRIWPEGGPPRWHHVDRIGREALAAFCGRFEVEVECPQSSADLRAPGPLENALITLLHDGIGIGYWPNHNRTPTDAAAVLIQAARSARVTGESLCQQDVANALALRVDFGRVEENVHVDERRLVPRSDALDEISTLLIDCQRVAVTGSPGIGKTWLLAQLARRLRNEGWIVGTHYCFVDLYDSDRASRVSIEATFGSIMAELLDADPSLSTDTTPRFAAGPRELQLLLDNASAEKPSRRVAILVDGLDHVDRLAGHSGITSAADLVEELAALRLPQGNALVIGSQPGDHLNPLLENGRQFHMRRWPDGPMRTIAERTGVVEALRNAGLERDTERLLDRIVEKSNGNPLYATYLGRTAVRLALGSLATPAEADIADYLAGMPAFDEDLTAYYRWLLRDIAREDGQSWITELLALVGFPVSEEELGAILPGFRHHVAHVLSHLAPVLDEEVSRGGIRIYHESFQRYVREMVESASGADVGAVLAPAIEWLKGQGFFSDPRSFRFLLGLLRRAGRDSEVSAYIGEDFVAMAASRCQPADAVQANLTIAAVSAASLQDWAALARLVELSRAADYLYQWRLDSDHTLAELYGRVFADLYGAQKLADRLLYDGRCTFPARPGLILCQLCDDQGASPPWMEYLAAHDKQRQTDNTSYDSDSERALDSARLTGRMRLKGREASIRDCIEWLKSSERLPLHAADIALTLGGMYGSDTLLDVVDGLPLGERRAWVRFALMHLSEDADQARAHAESAIREGLPHSGWRSCLRAGADPGLFARDSSQLPHLTKSVLSDRIQFQEEALVDWLTEIELAAAIGDEGALLRAEASIPPDSWFRRWLRFCVTQCHPKSTADDMVASLHDLGRDIQVFQGDPRVCDLYGLHTEIQRTFRRALGDLDDDRWSSAAQELSRISAGTSTWLQGSRSGPLPVDSLLQLVMGTADTEAKLTAASGLGAQILSPELRGSELYDTHAQDSLMLARIHAAAGQRSLSEAAWFEACRYLAGYGWRKDITVYELLDSIKALASGDVARARQCLHEVQYVVEAVLAHTDGKETRHAVHQWLDLVAEIHPAGALAYLARTSISRVPDFGGFDHAMPIALAALHDQLLPLAAAAGWIGAAIEARADPAAAIRACECAFASDADAGNAVWSGVVASIEGDGASPPSGLKESVEESARRLGVPPPLIEEPPEARDKGPKGYPRRHSFALMGISHVFPTLLPASASPLQIVRGVRDWNNWRGERPNFEMAANAVGWRLAELLQAGEESSAMAVIRRIALDTLRWDSNELLEALAEGLAARGQSKPAALAFTYAYTRTRDGWRRFGGPKAEQCFARAIRLDDETAWSVLADEVADSVAYGGEYGVTAHMIELLIAGGRIDDGFAAWEAACAVVTFRLPSSGPQDNVSIPYDHDVEDPSGALAESIVARMNHYLLHERRLAAAGVALLARHSPTSIAAGLRLAAMNGAPSSTLIALLHLVSTYESQPYEATQAAAPELQSIARGDLVSARVLARRLLERAGLTIPLPPPLAGPVVPLPSEERTAMLIKAIGALRIEQVDRFWPEFGQRVVAILDKRLKSEELKERMQRAIRQIDPSRKGRHIAVWLPVDEEIEHVLQTTGAAVRVAMAQRGILDPHVEDQVGMALLGDVEIGVRLALSRIVRPHYIPVPSSLTPGYSACDVITVLDGVHAGWVVAGSRETELTIGDGYNKPVEGRIEVYSGVVLGGPIDSEGLPFGHGKSIVWRLRPPIGVTAGRFHGPLTGLEILRDPFGSLEILSPHPDVSLAAQLAPARFECGLTLVDAEMKPAVVCRVWRERPIGDEYPGDREHRLAGMHLLVRRDVFESFSAGAPQPLKYATLVTLDHEVGED